MQYCIEMPQNAASTLLKTSFATASSAPTMSSISKSNSSSQQMQDGCITKDQLAKYLNVSVGLINKLMAEMGLPHLKIGRSVRFRLTDVLNWFDRKGMKV